MVGSPGGGKRVPERVALDNQRAIELLDGDSLSREHRALPMPSRHNRDLL